MAGSTIAPVAFFVFNRPQLTLRVYERIRAARPRKLLVVADGPRSSRPDEGQLCAETRKIVNAPDWPCELHTNFADENQGCRRRLSSGLDWVFQQCSEAIILEDDCLPGPSFFGFCSEMLHRYRDDDRVMHVSGDNFQDGHWRGNGSYYFSRYSLSWGWATWSRAWRYYDVDVSAWPAAYRTRWLESFLDSQEEVRFWESHFDRLYRGLIDTWDYQWLFACWRQNGLSILPNQNLVTNIGVGPDATHFREGHSTVGLPTHDLGELLHPKNVVRDKQADQYTFEKHIRIPTPLLPRNWLQKVRQRVAFKARVERMLPRSLRYW